MGTRMDIFDVLKQVAEIKSKISDLQLEGNVRGSPNTADSAPRECRSSVPVFHNFLVSFLPIHNDCRCPITLPPCVDLVPCLVRTMSLIARRASIWYVDRYCGRTKANFIMLSIHFCTSRVLTPAATIPGKGQVTHLIVKVPHCTTRRRRASTPFDGIQETSTPCLA
jgi:hypothetical protein